MAQAGLFEWARSAGGTNEDIGKSIAIDVNGNCYVAGTFGGVAQFASINITNTGQPDSTDIFLAKYNSVGLLQWLKQISGTNSDSVSALAVDAAGNVFITGTVSAPATFGSTNLAGMSAGFLAKYSADGIVQWARRLGSGTNGGNLGPPASVAVDSESNCFIIGHFFGTILFDQTNLTSAGGSIDLFIAKYKHDGTLVWAKRDGGTGDEQARGIAVDTIGRVYVTGIFSGSATFGSTNFTSDSTFNTFIARYSNQGTLDWIQRSEAGGAIQYGFTVDALGSSYVIGGFSYSTSFSGHSLTGSGQGNIFIVKYNNVGILEWVNQIGELGTASGRGVAANSAGDCFIIGDISSNVLFNGVPLNTHNGMFLAKYNSAGVLQWVQQPSGEGGASGMAVALDRLGNCFATGSFFRGVAFGSDLIQGTGNDVFVAKRASSVVPLIVAQPQRQIVVAGDAATFNVTVGGPLPMSFQWQKNGVPLSGQTSNSIVIGSVQALDAGNYTVVVSNADGSTTSMPAYLQVENLVFLGNGQIISTSLVTFVEFANIELRTTFTNGTILYSLDGSAPTFTSEIYNGSFMLTNSAIIRAIAYNDDFSQMVEAEPIEIILIPVYWLTATTAGGGTVSLNPTSGTYASNSIVALIATSTPGWSFLHWTGDAVGTNAAINIWMNRAKAVQAVFATKLYLTVAAHGVLTLKPNQPLYPYGSSVRVIAIPQAGYQFALWGNAASGRSNPLEFFVMNPNSVIAALFAPLEANQFTLTVSEQGEGRSSKDPNSNTYTNGQVVILTAEPTRGFKFTEWSGDIDSTQNPLTVILTSSKIVTANFANRVKLTCQRNLALPGGGGVQLTLEGEVGERYILEESIDLFVWSPLATITNFIDVAQYLDTSTTNQLQRFYRAVLLP